eukprot:tig00021127_g18723.t1
MPTYSYWISAAVHEDCTITLEFEVHVDSIHKEEFPTHVVNPYTSSSDQKAIKAAVKKMEKGAATFRAPKQEKKEDAMFTSDMMSSVFDTTHDEFPHGAEMTVPFSGPTSAADIKSAAKKSQGVYKKAGPAPPATPANKTFIGEAVQKSFETTAGESNYPQGNRDAAFKEPFLSQQEIRKRMKDQGL